MGPIINIPALVQIMDNGLAPNWQQAIIWAKGGLAYWRIYASLGLNE